MLDENQHEFGHYFKSVAHIKWLDWYRVCKLFDINSTLAHAGKKIAFAGKRGSKNYKEDIQEAIATLVRELEMLEEDEDNVTPID